MFPEYVKIKSETLKIPDSYKASICISLIFRIKATGMLGVFMRFCFGRREEDEKKNYYHYMCNSISVNSCYSNADCSVSGWGYKRIRCFNL